MPSITLVYRTCGGDQLVISSGGVFEMQDGAVGSMAGQAITTTGTVTGNSVVATSGITASGGLVYAPLGFRSYLESYTSAAAALTGYGVSVIGTSSGTAHNYTVTPIVGVMKLISCVFTTAATPATVTSTAAWNAAGNTVITFTTGGTIAQYIEAVGQTVNRWHIVDVTTDMTFA